MVNSIYQEGDSFLHRLNSFTSLIVGVSLIALVFIVPDYRVPLVVFVLLVLLTFISGVYKRVLLITGTILIPLFLLLTLVQGILNPAHHGTIPLIEIGPIIIWQPGFEVVRLIVSRIGVLMVTILLIATTSQPARLRITLIEHGVPPKIAYVLLASLQTIPELVDRTNDIMIAQQARGLNTKGSIKDRTKGFQALMFPLLIRTLDEANTRALALDSRGFNRDNAHTFLYNIPDPTWQRVLRRISIAVVVIAIIVRLVWYVT